jgi:hypothetical protein
MVDSLFPKKIEELGLQVPGARFPSSRYVFDEFVRLLLLPIFFGLVLGWNKAGLGVQLSTSMSITYWCGICLLIWLPAHAFTLVVSRTKWVSGKSVSAQLLLGIMFSSLLVGPAMVWYVGLFRDGDLLSLSDIWFRYIEFSFQNRVRQSLVTVVVWVIANLGWMSIRRYSPYGQQGEIMTDDLGGSGLPAGAIDSRQSSDVAPTHLRIGNQEILLETIVAVKAEDHYVCVFQTDGTKSLIHGRFSDISSQVKDLSAAIRVHRSYWVNLNQVTNIHLKGRVLSLEMSNGLSVPVSETHRALLETAMEGGSPSLKQLPVVDR